MSRNHDHFPDPRAADGLAICGRCGRGIFWNTNVNRWSLRELHPEWERRQVPA